MADILEISDYKPRQPKRASSQTSANGEESRAARQCQVVIFPGIRVDYGPVDQYLAKSQ